MCVFREKSVMSFILDVRLVHEPAGVTPEEGHTGFLIHLPSAVAAAGMRKIEHFNRQNKTPNVVLKKSQC